ncbi:MAG: hypothetical protein CGW95_07260 [Phenylobacterium zucineum]|nr:MAG: hypothetical protein CGW95_07260 [Phenylobacterium zucineum]
MEPSSKLQDLIALAEEPSSERRRALLRGVTDLFFTSESEAGPEALPLFDDVLSQLAGEMEVAVRAELSHRMCMVPKAPQGLIRKLAADESLEVSGYVLQNSPVLTDTDLIDVAKVGGQGQLKAISRRMNVSEVVSDVIVARGDDETLGTLVSNPRAQMSRQAQETVVDRALINPDLHLAVVNRASLPPDLLNEMYFVVEANLRAKIMERNSSMDPVALDAALAKGREKMATRDGALPPDYESAEKIVKAMLARGPIGPSTLAGFLRNRETTKFLVALADSAGIDFGTARRILEKRELDALSIICKASGFDRSLFLTFAILILDKDDNAMGKARSYGETYEALPKEAAERTIRFWRMRRQNGDVLAA